MKSALQCDLEVGIGGEVRFDQVSRALYSTDASVYEIQPVGVVIPRGREDVLRVVEIARRHGTSITARGGGTSQAGQAVGAGLQLDTSKYFNRILQVNARERWARVEPGVVLDELNADVRRYGLKFAPDVSTASRATIGGMIANNSSGARSVLYGKTINYVRELEVVLADARVARLGALDGDALEAACSGDELLPAAYRSVRAVAKDHATEVDRRFPKILRRVGGYNLDEFVNPSKPFNLARLIVGSEGTLALIVEAKIDLVPLPRSKAVLAIEFEDLLDALAATPAILELRPSAVEVMDRFILDHARTSPALNALRRSILQTDAGALLAVEFYADDAGDLIPMLDRLERRLAGTGARCSVRRAIGAEEQARIWHLREAALGLSMAMKGDDKSLSFVEDTAVEPAKLRDYIERFLQLVRRHGTVAGVYAHASVGCLHVRPVVNLKTADGLRRFEAIANDVSDLVLEFGGALSGEHGDGLVRGPFTAKMFGPRLYEAFRTIKRSFDPDGLFNPGKIVDTPPLTANLRYGATYQTADPPTYFDFSTHGGLGRAVEMCSGLGACRKKLDGTMCPSYMATLDEKDSTRGRANALRLALTGRLGESGLADEGVYGVLDLCLECRACKAECPVGVDVARFKSEFLADYWAKHPMPWRTRVIGHARTLSEWGSRTAPVSNAIARSTIGRWLGDKLLHLDRRRTSPAWARQPFERVFARRNSHQPLTTSHQPIATSYQPLTTSYQLLTTGRPTVVLFNDTFTNFYHPEIGVAAAELLEAAGLRVRLASHGCCGRPLISQGLLGEARALARANAESLYADAQTGEPIVFLEPSCLSAMREDAPALLRADAQRKAEVVAAACVMLEDYLERQWRADRLQLRLRPGPSRILFHGHCHQKAMGLSASSRALLSRIPACEVTDLDAGCCGMAGSFGLGSEHYEISHQIGERRLLPAARRMGPGTVLAAAGVSCRQQVAHFAGVNAVHPAVLLRTLLATAEDAQNAAEQG
jgi:FAD/FMN-containing dehydrogenase/Fe-S oxidoreductase